MKPRREHDGSRSLTAFPDLFRPGFEGGWKMCQPYGHQDAYQQVAAATRTIILPLNAMKTIVALVDFSDVPPKVADHALELAQKIDGEIILVHVVPPMPIVVDYAAVAASDGEHTDARLAQLEALEGSMKERYAKVSTRLFNGAIVETLLTHLPALNPDLIVMGSHGHGALYNLIVGSVTQAIIKHAAWPVLIIPKVRVKELEAETPSASEKVEEEKMPPVIGAPGGALLPP